MCGLTTCVGLSVGYSDTVTMTNRRLFMATKRSRKKIMMVIMMETLRSTTTFHYLYNISYQCCLNDDMQVYNCF